MSDIRFKKAERRFMGPLKKKEKVVEGRTVMVGASVTVPNTHNFAFVRIRGINSMVRCDTIAHAPNIPVWVGKALYGSTGFRVLDIRDRLDVGFTTSWNLPPHHERHEWGSDTAGDDVVWVWLRQMLPLRVSLNGGMEIRIESAAIETTEGWVNAGTTEGQDLTNLIPGSGALYALIYYDSAGVLQALAGSTVAQKSNLLYTDIPATPAGGRALAAVRLYNGQTELIEERFDSDIIDLRWSSSGGGGGGGGGSAPLGVGAVESELDYDITKLHSESMEWKFIPKYQGIYVGDATNYMHADDDGTVRLYGDATAWDDLRFPAVMGKPGASQPDWVQFKDDGAGSVGVFTYQFDKNTDEELFFAVQLPHAWLVASDIEPHVHWAPTDTDTGAVVWGLEYTWANIDGTYGNTTIITITDAADGTAYKHQLADFATVSGTGKEMSSMLMCRVFRDANNAADTYDADAALLEFDIHYQIDSFGSDEEYVK